MPRRASWPLDQGLTSGTMASSRSVRGRALLVPWLLALVGLAIPLVATEFATSPIVALWLLALAALWLAKPLSRASQVQRVALAFASLPLLVLTATLFGLYLIPAALAWLVIELAALLLSPARIRA